jgi:hypothetical protein
MIGRGDIQKLKFEIQDNVKYFAARFERVLLNEESFPKQMTHIIDYAIIKTIPDIKLINANGYDFESNFVKYEAKTGCTKKDSNCWYTGATKGVKCGKVSHSVLIKYDDYYSLIGPELPKIFVCVINIDEYQDIYWGNAYTRKDSGSIQLAIPAHYGNDPEFINRHIICGRLDPKRKWCLPICN